MEPIPLWGIKTIFLINLSLAQIIIPVIKPERYRRWVLSRRLHASLQQQQRGGDWTSCEMFKYGSCAGINNVSEPFEMPRSCRSSCSCDSCYSSSVFYKHASAFWLMYVTQTLPLIVKTAFFSCRFHCCSSSFIKRQRNLNIGQALRSLNCF